MLRKCLWVVVTATGVFSSSMGVTGLYLESADVRATESPKSHHTQRASLPSHRYATVHTAPRPAPLSLGYAAICAAGLTPSVPLSQQVAGASQGTGGTVLSVSHLQGNPTTSHRTGPAELEADSGQANKPVWL